MDKFEQRYLGDGIYASFDGYQVWLHVGRHDVEPVVTLEPAVIDALNAYFRDVVRPVPHDGLDDGQPSEQQEWSDYDPDC